MTTVTKDRERRVERTNGSSNSESYLTPEVNIFETAEAYTVEAEMPGVSKEGLEVTLEGSELIIVGHRADWAEAGELVYRESRPFGFRRVFELDPSINTTTINARMDQGILTLTLPKQEKVKPRKITIE